MNALAIPSGGSTVTLSPDMLHRSASGGAGLAAASAPCLSDRETAGSRGEGVTLSFLVDNETAADAAARDALLDRAMGPRWRRKASHRLRRGRLPSQGLALVARDAHGTLVGTVRLWDVTAGEHGPAALLLGPLAVEPSLKSAGIGSALMRRAIAQALLLGHRAILLVGDEPYYGRFGFSAQRTGRLAMPGPYERHRLLALELAEGALDGAAGVIRAGASRLQAESPAVARMRRE